MGRPARLLLLEHERIQAIDETRVGIVATSASGRDPPAGLPSTSV